MKTKRITDTKENSSQKRYMVPFPGFDAKIYQDIADTFYDGNIPQAVRKAASVGAELFKNNAVNFIALMKS